MPCGYCGAPERTVRQCSCARARRYVAANLKGGATKHPNPPLMPPPPPPSPRRGHPMKPPRRRSTLRRYVCLPRWKPRPPPPRRLVTSIRGLPLELFQLRRSLGDAIRDKNVRRRRGDLAARDGGANCYYLRERRPRLDVDHAFECQAMGHALTQCESWHRHYREEAFIDGKVSRHGGLRKLCDSVASVQNALGNLYLLDDGLNRSKRHAFSESLDALRVGGCDVDLPHLLTARCVKWVSTSRRPCQASEPPRTCSEACAPPRTRSATGCARSMRHF